MAQFSVRDISLVNRLDRARKDFNAIKSAQFYGGSQMVTKESITPIIASKDDIFDNVYYGDMIFGEITFTAKNQSDPIGKLLIDLRVGSPTTPDTGGAASVLYYVINPPIAHSGKLTWGVDIRSAGNFWAVFKVLSSNEGTVVYEEYPPA